MPINLQDHYRGCLLGVALGDCLGGLREEVGLSSQSVTEIPPGSNGSDDLAMTLCLAEAITESGRYDSPTALKQYIRWFNSNPKGIGRATYLSLSLIAIGEEPDVATEQAHTATGGLSAGNGVAMRCAPLALCYRGDRDTMAQMICIDGKLTHYDLLARHGAVAVALILDALLVDSPEIPRAILDAGMDMNNEQVGAAIGRVGLEHGGTVHPSGFVLDTIHAALTALSKTSDFESCLIHAVGYGGDADTIGSIAGGLAGAAYGVAAIPERWLDALEGKETIIRLADELLELSHGR